MTCSFEVLATKDSVRFGEILDSLSEGDIHFSLPYLQVFREEGTPQLFVYREETRFIIYPFIMREISLRAGDKLQYYDITSPYGYGGPLCSPGMDGQTFAAFQRQFGQYCRDNRIVSEFIRFHPMLTNHRLMEGTARVERVSSVVYLDLLRPLEDIWSGFLHSCRKNIKRAIQEKVAVVIDDSPDNFSQFLAIYRQTMDRNSADRFYYFSDEFFARIHSQLKGKFIYAHALVDGEIVSTELLLYSKDYIHSYLGGTLARYFPCRPNNLLKFEIIKWARAKGIKYFVLGGGKSDGDGIHRFKKTFSNAQEDFYIGKKVHLEDIYNQLTGDNFAAKGMDGFFPSYRR